MTVADNTSRNQYTATPSQALFAYTFEIVDKDDIVVLINGIPLSEGTDYTVTGVGSDTGGNIVLTSGTTGGNIVTIYRDMPYARTQNYTNSGDFLASEVNSDFDSLWLAGEQTNRAFSQSIRKPITDSDSISMELPEAASRANKFVKFDSNGAVDLAAGVTTDVAADDVSITDAGGYYTSDNVEGALQEIGAQPPGFDPNTDSFNIGSDAVSSGTDSIALGHDASATAARDIALGLGAVASGGGSIAIGQETDSTGVRSIAIGKGAQSTFSTSIALGEDASTLGGAGGSPVAIGYNASSTGISGISLGPNTTASGSQSISIGDTVSATGTDSIALGHDASASGSGSTALGHDASVTGQYSTALGYGATVTATTAAIAIGDATASGIGSMAIHDNSLSSGLNSMAIGYSSQATVASAMAVGYSSEATAVSSTALGHDASAIGDKSISIGFESSASSVDAIAIGTDTDADALGSIAIGTGSDASQVGSIALGKGAQAIGAGSTIAIGEAATTAGGLASPIAIGYQANTTGAYGVGIGYQTVTSGAQSIAIGYIASATNDNGIAIGRQLTVAGQKAVGIGWGAVAGAYDSIGIGTSANASTTDCISMGGGSQSLSTGGVAIGSGAQILAASIKGVAVGYGAQAQQIGGVAVGNNAICNSQFGTALGRDSNASFGSYATALGYGSVADNYATAINNSDATGARSVAIGHSAVSSSDDSIAIGYNADALGTDSIAIGNIAGADAANTIHINASGVATNQPQTAGYIVIETDDASLNYDGSWSLTGGALELPDGLDVTGVITTAGMTTSADINFGDNDKAVFGAGSDLQIYHDGSHNFIEGVNAGNIYIRNGLDDGDVIIQSDDGLGGVANYVQADGSNGEVRLFHYGSEKLNTTSTGVDVTGTVKSDDALIAVSSGYANLYFNDESSSSARYATIGKNYDSPFDLKLTASNSASSVPIIFNTSSSHTAMQIDSTGIDVTGTVTADGLNLDGNIQGDTGQNMQVSAGAGTGDKLDLRAGDDVRIYVDGATSHKLAANFANNGDVSLFEDTGTTPKFFWDASAESLGIGTSSPSVPLEVEGSVKFGSAATGVSFAVQSADEYRIEGIDIDGNGFNSLHFRADGTDGLFLQKDTNNVGIGTSSPANTQGGLDAAGAILARGSVAANQTSAGGFDMSGNALRIRSWGATAGTGVIDFRTGGGGGSVDSHAMRIDSSGNVGIGTTLPTKELEIQLSSTTGNTLGQKGGLQFTSLSSTAGNGGEITWQSGTGNTERWCAISGHIVQNNTGGSSGDLVFATKPLTSDTTLTEAMRIDSAGNVGIGEDNPVEELHISGSVPKIQIQDSDGTNQYGQFYHSAGITSILARNGAADGAIAFQRYDGTTIDESARIDSSGNLLVGQSSTTTPGIGNTTLGSSILAGGLAAFSRAGGATNATLYVNKNTDDGPIARFSKDGNEVGSIGANVARFYIHGSYGSGSGLRFDNASIRPATSTGTSSDATTDLGASAARYKDLYLSGGAYLGGTAAANKLDDYEEGTWTPVSSNYSGTLTVNNATYTKVGNLVTARASVSFDATTDGSGVSFSGIPFTHTGVDKGNGGFVVKSSVASASRMKALGIGSVSLVDTTDSNVTYTTVASTTLSFVFIYEAA